MNIKLDQEINIVSKIKNKTILILSNNDILIQLEILKKLKKLDNINTVVTTSKTSFLAFLYVLGYNIDELYNLFLKEKIENNINEIIKKKNIDPNITFRDLFKKIKIKLIITATCLNDKKTTEFSYETFPEMKISLALHIANTHIPYMYNNKLYIDGSYINPYPIDLFKNQLDEIIGIYVEPITTDHIHDIIYYLSAELIVNNLFIIRSCKDIIIIDKKNYPVIAA